MKVLHVMPYSPEPPIFGGALRNYHLLKNLVEYNQVTLVCFGTPDVPLKLKKKFNSNLQEIHVVPDLVWTESKQNVAERETTCINWK